MLTRFKKYAQGGGPLVLLCLYAVLSGGCASQQPWTQPVGDEQAKAIRTLVTEKNASDAACSSTLDAEVTVSMKTLMDTKSFSGFLQLKLPSSVKFVTINPLGQTIFALVSNGKSFRSVNTLESQFVSGGLEALAIRNDLPPELMTGRWGAWLSDRIDLPENAVIADIRQDVAAQGVWIKIIRNSMEGGEYILINPADGHLLARLLTDANDKTIARINYSDWQGESKCTQPATILISSESKGVDITIHLSGIITDKVLTERDFWLNPPPGYYIRLFP